VLGEVPGRAQPVGDVLALLEHAERLEARAAALRAQARTRLTKDQP
jgi:hypothetical protein